MALKKISGSMIAANTITGDDVANGTISTTDLGADVVLGFPSPTANTIIYPGDDTAADPAGSQTITITGNNFDTNTYLIIDSTIVNPSAVNTTSLSFTSPAKAAGSYLVFVVNPDGAVAIIAPGIQYSTMPAFSTAAGSVANNYEYATLTASVAANSDSNVVYTTTSGDLPSGVTLASNGALTGTLPTVASPTTYSFTVSAIDAENQSADRTFSITVHPDAVTWSAPANNSSYTLPTGTAITALDLDATSAAGKAITYSAVGLPTGLSVSGNTIVGTPSTAGSFSANVVATANVTNKTANVVLSYTVEVPVAFAATGGTITTVNGYTYHTFTSNGTFAVTDTEGAVTVDYLVVAGGGGGGGTDGNGVAGGGAGGYRSSTFTPSIGDYQVIVGAGGTGGAAGGSAGSAGANSSVFGTTSAGGGGGGGRYAGPSSGGSGGGSEPFNNTPGSGNVPSVSPAQGYAGGSAPATTVTGRPGGGGGGAGGVGTNGVATKAGNGGIGRQWLDGNYYAGGGGGGINSSTAGQQGVGVHGGATAIYAGSASANSGTGGGGAGAGGGNSSIPGGNGGSGIVIIRYPA